mmetsp:Transcript_16145/g.26665  ORF Transcript_16145/g.26665 Transcript_16145/m.26665 type:complete len:107 (+) Transcript_16145:110-430(+)
MLWFGLNEAHVNSLRTTLALETTGRVNGNAMDMDVHRIVSTAAELIVRPPIGRLIRLASRAGNDEATNVHKPQMKVAAGRPSFPGCFPKFAVRAGFLPRHRSTMDT